MFKASATLVNRRKCFISSSLLVGSSFRPCIRWKLFGEFLITRSLGIGEKLETETMVGFAGLLSWSIPA